MFYKTVIFLIKILVFLLFNVTYEGKENIPPPSQGFILAPNHRSYLDPLLAAITIPQPLRFMAKEELFKNSFFAWFITKLGAYPIARGKGNTSTLVQTKEILQSGEPILIFPEGTRSKSGVLGRPKSGAALLAGQAGVGILPFTIDYGSKLHFRSKIRVIIQPLLTPEALEIDLESPRSIRNASRMVMDAIALELTHLPIKEETHEP